MFSKWQLSALFPSMGLSRRYHHVYDDKDIPYDAWSNIHFGVIGRYCEFSESELLYGADIQQHASNSSFAQGDTKYDQAAIKIGFLIYNNYKNNKQMNAKDILLEIIRDNIFKKYFEKGEYTDEGNK